MRTRGYPKTPFLVTVKNDFLKVGQEVWIFSKGDAYVTETIVRDDRFEIRIISPLDNFEEISSYLTIIEDYGN